MAKYTLQQDDALPLKTVKRADIPAEVLDELSQAAGVDRYVASVVYGQLTAPWRGHPAGSAVVRSSGSSGYVFAVQDPPEGAPAPAPTPAPAVPPAPPAPPAPAPAPEPIPEPK